MDLRRAQRRGGVGGEVRVAGAAREHHHAALLEVALRAPPDVGLGHVADLERREHARVEALLLERVLERERVDHARHHAHVVGVRAVHALGGGGDAADHVAAADHHAQIDAELVDLSQLLRDALDHGRADAEPALAGELLAGELDQEPAIGRLHSARASSPWPSLNRSKRGNVHLRRAPRAASPTDLSGSFTNGCSTSATSDDELVDLPVDDPVEDLLRLARRERLLAVDLALRCEQLGRDARRGSPRPGSGRPPRCASRCPSRAPRARGRRPPPRAPPARRACRPRARSRRPRPRRPRAARRASAPRSRRARRSPRPRGPTPSRRRSARPSSASTDAIFAILRDRAREPVAERGERVGARDEVGLAAELDHRAGAARDRDRDQRPRWWRAPRACRPWRARARAAASVAFSRSPSASASARLQSIIPAPVCSRRVFTSFAEISATPATRSTDARGCSLAGAGALGASAGSSRSAGARLGAPLPRSRSARGAALWVPRPRRGCCLISTTTRPVPVFSLTSPVAARALLLGHLALHALVEEPRALGARVGDALAVELDRARASRRCRAPRSRSTRDRSSSRRSRRSGCRAGSPPSPRSTRGPRR